MENGVPAEVSWQALVSWTLAGERPKGDTPKIRIPAANCIGMHPGVPQRAQASGISFTIVRYQLVSGEVTSAAIERNSGDAVLDGYATSCVQT